MNRKTKKSERVAIVGVMAAFAAILSYIEALIPFSIWIPGVKLGLANIAIVVVLYLYGANEALAVNFVRVIIVGMLFGNVFSTLFSLAGAAVSFCVMLAVKKTDCFTIIGVSVAGGTAHNIGQILVASAVINSYSVIYYLPALIIAGVVTGIVIGLVSRLLIKYIMPFVKGRAGI